MPCQKMTFNKENISGAIQNSQTIVIKVGSSLLVDDDGNVRQEWLRTLSADIKELISSKTIIIVSSGAIALGAAALGIAKHELDLSTKQVVASVGQQLLMQHWQSAFHECCETLRASQLLLRRDDFRIGQHRSNVSRYFDAIQRLRREYGHSIIPIINENDATDVAEIRFGDNDQLAAHVGELFKAELVILLSKGIDGLCNKEGHVVSTVSTVNDEVRSWVKSDAKTTHGTGGMTTKLDAAEIILGYGGSMMIARGEIDHPLRHLQLTGWGTYFGQMRYG